VIAEKNAEWGEQAETELRKAGHVARFFFVDIADPDSVNALSAELAKSYKRIDGLVNNAALVGFRQFCGKRINRIRISNIHEKEPRHVSSFAEFGFGLFSPFRVFLGNHYLCPLSATVLGKGPSETASGSGNDDNPVFQ
jgi:NAD(P)-dependent dehydrogenase (short-subunit alcohol dehydrogenase family)